jgi:hypothetical protein
MGESAAATRLKQYLKNEYFNFLDVLGYLKTLLVISSFSLKYFGTPSNAL